MGIPLCDYFTKAVLVTSPLYNAHIGWCMNNVCSPKSLHVYGVHELGQQNVLS